jgi:hypothetical protein
MEAVHTPVSATSTSRQRIRGLLAGVVAVCALAAPATALAGTNGIYLGTLYKSQGWVSSAPRHSLNAVDFDGTVSDSLGYGCLNAVNQESPWGWANSVDLCVWPEGGRNYCACILRIGYAASSLNISPPANPWVNGQWWQTW